MRVAVSLVRASDGTTMWSHVYTASNQQTPTIRAAIGAGLVDALGVPQASGGRGYKPNGDAYALYLKGRALFRQRTSSSMEGARTLMIGAISLDPKFAAPYAYAGGITALLGEKSFQLDPAHPDGPSMTPTEAVEHALKLDPNLARCAGFHGVGRRALVGGSGRTFAARRRAQSQRLANPLLVDPIASEAGELRPLRRRRDQGGRARSIVAQGGDGSREREPVGRRSSRGSAIPSANSRPAIRPGRSRSNPTSPRSKATSREWLNSG